MTPMRNGQFVLALLIACIVSPLQAADWSTARASNARTGSLDGRPGPRKPRVLWVYESQEHFIASPAIIDGKLIVSGIGPFNTATLHALSLDPDAKAREVFAKAPPLLTQPVVSSPAGAGGQMVFGDGMHQSDGATLHCVRGTDGRSVWQLPLPGALIHIEGTPAIADGRAFIGGGSAGVLCVSLERVTLDGEEQSLEQITQHIDQQWQEMQTAYEADKRRDPDFAIPPDEQMLPKPQPLVLWQTGQDALHIDSSLAVNGGSVYAASAFLDTEQIGDRALLCLDADTGEIRWRTPLDLNPWAGPTLSGGTLLVGCSSIRFDPKQLAQARGEVVALDAASGQVRWRRPVPGGVVASIAAAGQLAIIAATDGVVRAMRIADGAEAWSYKAANAFFAAPAVTDSAAYVADLHGNVHAINLADGKLIWTLDLAADASVNAAGMVYASPVLHDGRLYLATSNLETDQQRTVVVCIGE